MSNEKKQVKTNDLFASAFKSAPDHFWDLLQNMTYTYTTMSLLARLYKYFSSENGRQAQKKLYYYCDLKNELGKNNKPASRNTIENSIKEIRESNLFIVNESWKGKEKTVCFYILNEKNLSIFEKVENNLGNFYQETIEFFKENNLENNIIDIKKSSHFINLSSQSNDLSSHSFDKSRQVNDVEIKKNQKTYQVNDFSENATNLINNDLETISKTPKESYIKESIYKEALTLEEKNILNDSTLQKKLLDSELRLKGFLKSDEIKIKEEKEIMKDNSTLKNDIELDRIKSILVGQFGFYENLAENYLTTKSIKCLDECIQSTIEAQENGTIKSNTRTYFKMKLENWVEKKDIHASSPRSSEIIAPKTLNGEKEIIDFCFDRKFIFGGNKNLKNAVISLLYWFDGKKDLMNDFKKLNLSIEEIKAIFTELEKDQSCWKDDSWKKKQSFLNAFNNPNFSIEQEKIIYIPTKTELDNKMYKALEGKILPSIGNPFAQKKVILEDKKDNNTWCGFGSKVTFSENTNIESKESKKDNLDNEEIPM